MPTYDQSITTFISAITNAGGVARPNRYSVSIYQPNIVSQSLSSSNNLLSVATQLAQQNQVSMQSLGTLPDYFKDLGVGDLDIVPRLDFMCCKAELPGKTFNTSDVRTYGATFEMPYVDVYSDITLAFIVGRDMVERDFFDAWSYTIQDPETSDFNYVNDYATTVDIYQLDEFGQTQNYGCRLFQAWPKTIGELSLSYDQFNTFHILPITFTYRKWINVKINTNTPTSITATLGAPTPFEATISGT